jgi:D-arabinono-1,4-lactone oxidase
MTSVLALGEDGYFHPSTEEQIVELVRRASEKRRQVRVRGSGHTYPNSAIVTDRGPGGSGDDINVLLDKYRAIQWIDSQQGIVQVQAGCHLSIDPYDPASTVEEGLLYQLDQKGWALTTLGGISHQTVAGFLSTGSSGGTVKWHISDNVIGIRLIDGTGRIWELSREQDADAFNAAGVSMGLLGIISTITFKGVPRFNIVGQEAITTYDECAVDLFGPGAHGKPGLEQWLKEIEYGRIMWWPQEGLERVAVWQARRIPWVPDFVPHPYRELGNSPELSGVMAGLLLTIIGNLDDLSVVPSKLGGLMDQLERSLTDDLHRRGFGKIVGGALAHLVKGILKASVWGLMHFPGMGLVARSLKAHLGAIIATLYDKFVPLDRKARQGKPQDFQDYGWSGLPMDNGVDDQLVPSWFSEIWVPISRVGAMVNTLKQHFEKGGLAATGTYSFEIYASKGNSFWMSPSYGSEDIARIDCLWFGNNAGDPVKFYEPYWELLKPLGFRLHWGKFLPDDPLPTKRWARYFSERYRHWDDFMTLRTKLDPHNIFLTQYWREHLGLESA